MAEKEVLQIPINKCYLKSESTIGVCRLASGTAWLGPIFLRVLGLRHNAKNI